MKVKTEISAIVRTKTLGLAFALGAASLAFAQQKVAVSGRVVDADRQPVPYASVTFSSKADKIYSDAALTDEKGNYSLQLMPGNYDITTEAIDYTKSVVNRQISGGALADLSVSKEKSATGMQTKDIQGVTITATTKPLKVEIDKKTYDVKSDITAIGGNLQDVLQNVPSVSVDPDGTVSMRGSSNVKFLVNGKPSALLGIDDGANALQSIPADQIDRIEVITNPSAKYDASGTAGILNIILKKNSKLGFNGSVVGTLGYQPKTALNTNLNWKQGKWAWFLNGGGGYQESKSKNWNDTKFSTADSNGNREIYQENKGKNTAENYNATAGFVFDVSERTSVNASGTVRSFNMINSQPLIYTYYPLAGATYYGSRISNGSNANTAFQGDFGLDHKFNDKGQNLSLALSLQSNRSRGNTLTDQQTNGIFQLADQTNQLTKNKSLVGKIDYELPLGENSMFNAGYKIDANNNGYDFHVLERGATSGVFTALPRYNNVTDYKETINALYAQFKSKMGNFGYQVGLRDEISKINVDYQNMTGKDSRKIDKSYNGLFPSVFLSYNFNKDSQLLLNYSRRIDRPRSFFLVPFMSYSDNQNVFRGNPDLNPSYIDSFELGFNISKRKFTINPTIYFKKENQDVKMSTAYLYDDYLGQYVFNTMPANLGYDQRVGLDLNYTFDPFAWWKIMGEVDVYNYKTTGDYYYSYPDPANTAAEITKHVSFAGKGFSTRLRLSTTFRIDKTFNFQLQGNYRGRQVEGANDQKANYSVNAGFTKTIWNGDGTIAFNIQDIFNTRGRRVLQSGDGFTRESFMQWQPRQAAISLTYRFKQGAKIEQTRPRKKDFNANDGSDDQMPM